MKKNFTFYKSLTVGIVIIFICSSFVSSISGYSEETNQLEIDSEDTHKSQEEVFINCQTFGFPGKQSHESSIPRNEADLLYEKIEALQIEVSRDPLSDTVHEIQNDIITIAKEHNLLPKGVSTDEVLSSLSPIKNANKPGLPIPRAPGKASEMLCNYVSTGTGSALPIIIFPRLVPILLTPIPRLFVRWSTYEGITSCGGLRSGKGFIASGAQRGIALGFWGIGFSIFIPPVKAYGLFGYALYASVNAENISFWPPNYPPEVTMLNPPNGAENVPISTSELSFHISDVNKALMNYTVTTTPDVGSGSGSNKPDGTYSIPISGLEGTEEYTWHIHVDDGVHEVGVSSSFTTEAVAPIVSDPKPEDGNRYVSIDLTQLSFHLSDPQSDLMDYTVGTVPDIGSGSGTGVSEGTYFVDISGLSNNDEYTWYVNVTDGENWKHKIYTFQVEPKMVFDPFEDGWRYRKKITIDHTKIAGDLENFPVLVSSIDPDLREKAQDDGDDILFMNDTGIATRLFHEIEYYDGSSGELIAWVNVTDLSSTQNTILYMYYGNESSENQQTSEKVWDSYYKAVYHMNDIDDGIHDSTINTNDGIEIGNPTYQQNGLIGKTAIEFYGQKDAFQIPNDLGLYKQDFTVECWVKFDDYPIEEKKSIIGFQGEIHAALFWMDVPSKDIHAVVWGAQYRDGEPWHHIEIIKDPYDTTNFHYYAATINNNYEDIGYYNGMVSGSQINDGITTHWEDSGIGVRMPHNDQYFDGLIEEVRISNVVRSSEWMTTSYNTMNNPSSFLSFGPEETSP